VTLDRPSRLTLSRSNSSPTIFKSIGVTGNTSLLTTGVFGVIKTALALVWCFIIIDRFGRRGILLVGATGGAISMCACSVPLFPKCARG
jgi:hypothetical protein